MMQFDFGKNWDQFSRNALTPQRVDQARADFGRLMEGVVLRDRSFLDIGFGQGLSLLIARESGARVTGCDINPTCAQVLERNRGLFGSRALEGEIPVVVGSILDPETAARLEAETAGSGYDIVHSWGVLHHTGRMWAAIDAAASLTAPGGHFVIAIYNTHWSSMPWKAIKWLYCKSPAPIQRLLVAGLYPVILAAKALVTRRNPFRQERGMDFYYNVIDWVGGYPYEYATRDEIVARLRDRGFSLVKFVPAKVPTGCNELVFTRITSS